MPLTREQQAELVAAAIEGYNRAYAPYSNYHVGAALLGTSGNTFIGCNVENAAYPASICAERTAITKAVSENEREFIALALVTRDGGSPCGICRQVMNEFAPNIEIIIANADGEILSTHNLPSLLPLGFGPSNLENND